MQIIWAFFYPNFLRRANRYLLLNFPQLWTTRFHYVVFYSFLTNIILALFARAIFYPALLVEYSTTVVWLVMVLEVGVFIFWLNAQSSYKVEQQFGYTDPIFGFAEAIIYTACTLLIFLPSVVILAAGVYTITHDPDLHGKNVCSGPALLRFYDSSSLYNLEQDYDMSRVNEALRLAQDIINSGVITEGKIWIEQGVVKPNYEQMTVLDFGDSIIIRRNQKVIVEDGEALVKVHDGDATLRQGEAQIIVKSETDVLVNSRDEIGYESSQDSPETISVEILSNAITISNVFTYTIGNDSAFIVEAENGMQIIRGPATIQSNGRFWSFDKTSAYAFCKWLHDPQSTPYNSDYFNFPQVKGWLAFIVVLGINCAVIFKHTNWRILSYALLYTIISIAAIFTVSFILIDNPSFPRIDIWQHYDIDPDEAVICLSMGLVAFFMVVQSARLISAKKYKLFAFINFISLPFLFGLIGFVLVSFIDSLDRFSAVMVYLPLYFLAFLLFAPLQKMVFIHLISLPKE